MATTYPTTRPMRPTTRPTADNVPTWRARIERPDDMGVSDRFRHLAKDTTGSVAL